MDWRQAEILDLISMYRESECLWNCLSPEYKDLEMKKEAWREIADHFERDIEEVKKKIKHLRTNYVVEKKKVEKRKDSSYEPRLFYYDELTFLDPVVVLRTSILMESEKAANRQMNGKRQVIKKREAQDSTDEEMEPAEFESTRSNYEMNEINGEVPESPQPQLTQSASPQPELEIPTDLSKEETFCAMICSELKLLKSEDVYDNLTLEIFSIVKNAKMAERHIVYQPEDDIRRA